MAGGEIEHLMRYLARLPGSTALGTTGRAAFAEAAESLMLPLIEAMQQTARTVVACAVCGNWDDHAPAPSAATSGAMTRLRGRGFPTCGR